MIKFTPKLHQAKAIDLVFNSEVGLNNFDRTQLIMACGTGKTFTSLQIAQKNIDKLVRELNILNVQYRNREKPSIAQQEKLLEINNAIDVLEKWLLVVTLTQ